MLLPRVFLEPAKAAHPWITYSDLWTLAGCVSTEAMGAKSTDSPAAPTASMTLNSHLGGLPDGAKGADHVRSVFMRMGFNDQEIVALSGAHNLGRCHTKRSGFEGKWVHSPTRFSNQYFRLLTRLEWKPEKLDNGVLQFVHVDEDLGKELMMLPADMALLTDPSFKEWVMRYADDKEAFYADFAKAFMKLMGLGIQRDAQGKVVNSDNLKVRYHSAPKKANKPGLPNASNEEAKPLRMENERFRARL